MCQSEKPAYILFSLYSVPQQAWLRAKVWYVGFVPLCILYQPVENSVPWPGYSIPTEEEAPLKLMLMSHSLEFTP